MGSHVISFFLSVGFLLCIALGITVPSFSQIAGGLSEATRTDLGGRNFITGNVILPSGSPPSERIRIRLSATGAEVITHTDDNGKFVIAGLPNGTYTVSFDADERYEYASQTVYIEVARNDSPQSYFVNLRLREKKRTDAKPTVVDVEFAGVPKKAKELFDAGMAKSAQGDVASAVQKIQEALAVHPDFMLAHAQLGVLYQKLNELDKADMHLQTALKLRPDAFDPLVNRGIVLFKLKRYDEAEKILRDTVKSRADFPVSHYYLGRTLFFLKKYDEAEAAYKRAYEIGGKQMVEARRALANLYLELGDDQKAYDELSAYLAEFPTAPDAPQLKNALEQIKAHLEKTPKENK